MGRNDRGLVAICTESLRAIGADTKKMATDLVKIFYYFYRFLTISALYGCMSRAGFTSTMSI